MGVLLSRARCCARRGSWLRRVAGLARRWGHGLFAECFALSGVEPGGADFFGGHLVEGGMEVVGYAHVGVGGGVKGGFEDGAVVQPAVIFTFDAADELGVFGED